MSIEAGGGGGAEDRGEGEEEEYGWRASKGEGPWSWLVMMSIGHDGPAGDQPGGQCWAKYY